MGVKLKICQQCGVRKPIGRTKKRCKRCRKNKPVIQGPKKPPRVRVSTSYDDYLASPWWKERKRRKIVSIGCRCEDCGAKHVVLHVHHITYARLYGELDSDLQVLCEPCHKSRHPGWE